MIKLEALRTFVTVAEAGNLKDASERLLRTPSALSMTLSQLEEQLGSPLFESDRKSTLTDLGRFVQRVAEQMVRDHDRNLAMIQSYAQNRIGTLRLASVPSVATHLLPGLLRAFAMDRPGIDIELVDTDSTDVQRLVESGQADIGVCGVAPATTALDFRPLFEDRFRLVCAATHPLARATAPLGWQDLAGAELILNESSRAISAPEYAALAADARLRMRNVASLLAMAQAGFGVTLLPELACASLPDGVVARSFEGNGISRVVGGVTRAGTTQSPLARAFEQYLFRETPNVLGHTNGQAVRLRSGMSAGPR